ncbi:hypothetical protein [Flammeovirga kamogawensis]|uniref:DUF1330 domain-containing protein n=1 Tax=Flammeovirga kamogawensis TaxID=373891 RepID=A0ABX8GU47_9BACT|nr:hypothetical protein [Flammeovirga kamogawensis]MBB6460034.1 uncharacterized protein (DUF1330 family) [Flammeovirga kamogawensis]QWG06918.1 hypothetical protein KM029_16655 [Flammeovirga kamogawensis]
MTNTHKSEKQRNEISIVFFPSRKHFVDMNTDPSFAPHFYHRQAALKEGYVMSVMEYDK